MIVGIVGSEAAKFNAWTEQRARLEIQSIIGGADRVVSGHCHLGGIDIWTIDEARKLGIGVQEFPPAKLSWEGGYKQRNLQIARASDYVVCITLRELPQTYSGMRFGVCYHCFKRSGPVIPGTPQHVKSGGCWTMHQARAMGKRTMLVILTEHGPNLYVQGGDGWPIPGKS